jgi:hypothetical protein
MLELDASSTNVLLDEDRINEEDDDTSYLSEPDQFGAQEDL